MNPKVVSIISHLFALNERVAYIGSLCYEIERVAYIGNLSYEISGFLLGK